MTSREIVRRALKGEATPRPAVGPLAVHCTARLAGVSLRGFTLDAGVLADCVVRYHREFLPDAIWLSADTWVSAEAMGAKVAFPGDDQPLGGTGEPLIKTATDIASIPPPDPTKQGRWPRMLDALRRIRRDVGPDVFVVACFDQYPFSLACAALGIERAMMATVEERPFLEQLLERCADYPVAYACALAEAGADLLSGGDSPAALLGPELHREIAFPFEQQVIARLKAATPLPVSLHVCGNAAPLLPALSQSGADVLELDQRTDLREACRVLSRDVAIWGNLDPVGVLARGTPADVARAAQDFLQTMNAAGHRRFVLSSGCTLAMETPPANLQALMRAAGEFTAA
jgi:MtaA/CmuA family methyltransferase